jgi:hypothetical protein
MELIYSPETIGTNFRREEERMWQSDAVSKTYAGKWNFTQICYLEHCPEVSPINRWTAID